MPSPPRAAHAVWLLLVTHALVWPASSVGAGRPMGPERPMLVRGNDTGRLPTLRVARRALGAAERRGEKFRVRRVPVRRDLEVDLELERFAVTGPRSRFVLGRRNGADVPLDFDPSEIELYRGRVLDHPGSRVVLALRDGRHTGKIDLGPGAPSFWISSRGERGEALAPDHVSVFEAAGTVDLPPGVPFCGVEPDADPGPPLAQAAAPAAPEGPRVGVAHLELAVETDYEFFSLFGDPVEAAAYLVALYGQVSDIYLRDVDTRVELVFTRIWETPDDLFNEVDPSPIGEFRSYWNANMGGVQRDTAQLVSGRRDYGVGGSAYSSSLCGSDAYSVAGYMQGKLPDPTQAGRYGYDISITAHELGHNSGTLHTHDSPNFVDTCDDPLTTPQRGTIMSYCAQTWSGGNANRDPYFHSTIQQNIDGHLGVSACIVADCNLNGIPDASDIAGATSADANSNGIPDECEDCNSNAILDPADIAMGAPDVDGDGIPDECQPDCNSNGVPDLHDIALATSLDAYGNDVPDECETDCNLDGTSDYTEIQLDMTLDIDRNAALDACQDCDLDTTPDLVELAGAHDLWLASGLDVTPLRRFYASTGVLSGTSAGSSIQEGQDLIVTDDLRVLVTSADDDRVAEFDVAGSYLGDLVATGSGGLDHPTGLVIAPAGDLLVASAETHEVLAYDATTGASQGAFVTAGLGGLDTPFGLAIGPGGNLFVTSNDSSVIEYDGTTGALVGTFVDSANNGGLSDPRGLLFKPDGNLLVTSFGSDETLEFRRETGFPLGRWAKSGNFAGDRLNQKSPWGLRIGPNGNVFITRTGEAFGSGGGGSHDHDDLHLTNAQMYEFDVLTGDFIRSHVNGNDHGMEFPTGFDFVRDFAIDCNANQLQDSCDIASGASFDDDSNSVPDECQADCNSNGSSDILDLIPFGASHDCNGNRIPDECDSIAGAPAACEAAFETTCGDGFDNDRDGRLDCADPDCDATGACLGAIVGGHSFDNDSGPFGYVDDAFRSTSQPAYASGAYGGSAGFEGGGGLVVSLGGIDGADILGMSGGWQRTFALASAADVALSFRVHLEQTHGYESDEYSQVLVSIDGALVGALGNDYVVQLTGDGQAGTQQPRSTGWRQFQLDLGNLGAGSHTLTLGGYNNKKTLADEETTLWLDDIGITTVLPFVCGDGALSPGEDCDDGGTADGDCCSSTCLFESAGSVCDDSSACFEPDTCDGTGACTGPAIDCDDADACTADACDGVSGCTHEAIPGCSGGAQIEVPASAPLTRGVIALMLAIASAGLLRRRR